MSFTASRRDWLARGASARSNWGDPPSLEARRAVLFGLLDTVPGPITVHVRRPMFIRDIFAASPAEAELTEAPPIAARGCRRIGWHDTPC